jgi:hypothetical protein
MKMAPVEVSKNRRKMQRTRLPFPGRLRREQEHDHLQQLQARAVQVERELQNIPAQAENLLEGDHVSDR